MKLVESRHLETKAPMPLSRTVDCSFASSARANQDGTLPKIEETDMSVPRSARSLSLERICL